MNIWKFLLVNCFDQDISLIIKMSLSMVLKCISSDFHRNNWRKLIKILDSIWMLLMEYWTSLLCTHWVCQQYCIRVYMYTCACMSIKSHLIVTLITVSLLYMYVVFNWQVHKTTVVQKWNYWVITVLYGDILTCILCMYYRWRGSGNNERVWWWYVASTCTCKNISDVHVHCIESLGYIYKCACIIDEGDPVMHVVQVHMASTCACKNISDVHVHVCGIYSTCRKKVNVLYL